jgi:hypothetical protein
LKRRVWVTAIPAVAAAALLLQGPALPLVPVAAHARPRAAPFVLFTSGYTDGVIADGDLAAPGHTFLAKPYPPAVPTLAMLFGAALGILIPTPD